MTPIVEKRATSVDEYIRVLSTLGNGKKTELWFRGHSQAEWTLLPSLYRNIKKRDDAREMDDETREQFIRMAPALSEIRPAGRCVPELPRQPKFPV